ncbi:IS30 family transposase, partial [Streptococcus pyogenes]|nr:IS30 family transposase [Streptococcus pyogenes]
KTTTPKEVAAIEHWINHYPKRLFNYKSPVEMLKLANFNLKFGDNLRFKKNQIFFKKSIDKKNQSAIIVRVLRRYPPKLLVRWSRG